MVLFWFFNTICYLRQRMCCETYHIGFFINLGYGGLSFPGAIPFCLDFFVFRRKEIRYKKRCTNRFLIDTPLFY